MMGWLKVFHVFGFILWMGGLMVLTRVLAVHAEKGSAAGDLLTGLEKRIFWGVGTAGMTIAVLSGLWMLAQVQFGYLKAKLYGPSFHIKLGLVVGLIAIHFVLQQRMTALQATGQGRPGTFKALHGVISTLLLGIVIVMMVVWPKAGPLG